VHYEGQIIRPPSEANSILLQATVGCSHHKCTFCGSYNQERFTIKPDKIIQEDIAFAAAYCKNQDRLFLCDRDALIIGNAKSIKMKSPEALRELQAHGLGIIYLGLETGDAVTLKKINKGATADGMIQMGKKARAAGIKLSITVLLGIAGRDRSDIHARKTGIVLSAIDPEYVGALSLMLIPGTPMFEDFEAGEFPVLEPAETLRELRTMIAHTDLSNGLFHSNHASNYLPIRAQFPKDKEATIKLIDEALAGRITLKPEYLRAL